MPQFDTLFWLSQIFWLILSFGGVYLGIRFIVFPMFDQIFSKRAKLIDIPLEKAEKLAQETQQLSEQVEHKKQVHQAHFEMRLNQVYQDELTDLKASLEKANKAFHKTFSQQIQKIENEEKKVLLKSDDFALKLLKGSQ